MTSVCRAARPAVTCAIALFGVLGVAMPAGPATAAPGSAGVARGGAGGPVGDLAASSLAQRSAGLRAVLDTLAHLDGSTATRAGGGVSEDAISVSAGSTTWDYAFDPAQMTVGPASTVAGQALSQWSPGGDARISATATALRLSDRVGTLIGTYPRLTGAGAPTWLGTGDGVVQVAPSGAPLATAQSVTPGWTQPIESARSGYGPYAVSPYGTEAVVRAVSGNQSALKLVQVRAPMSLGGQPEQVPAKDYLVSSYRPGDPAIAQEPGKGIIDPSSRTFIAFLGVEVGTNAGHLFVDYQDGRHLDDPLQPTAVVATGANCTTVAPAFSPSRTFIAYLAGVGPEPTPCSQTALRVVKLETSGHYDGATAKTLVTSPAGVPYQSISWRAQTPVVASGRVGGGDRYQVAVNVAKTFYNEGGARGAVIAGGDAYADALAGSPLAAAVRGPLLLTRRDRVDSATTGELTRILAPGAPVYVVGGEASVSNAVLTTLATLGHPVKRIGGADRFTVAVGIADELASVRGSTPTVVFVANGRVFPDALVSGPAVSLTKGVILLSDDDALPAQTKAYLDANKPSTLFGVGGGGTRSLAAYPAAQLISGADRFEVAMNVADRFFTGEWIAAIVSGRAWPDAATGGAIMGQLLHPILLTDGARLPAPTRTRLLHSRSATDALFAFGGPASVDPTVFDLAKALAGTQTVYQGPDLPR